MSQHILEKLTDKERQVFEFIIEKEYLIEVAKELEVDVRTILTELKQFSSNRISIEIVNGVRAVALFCFYFALFRKKG